MTKKSNPQPIAIKVVDNPTDQLKAFLVRGIVYMQEQDCPYAEEFDLNDFTCTQIIGLIGDEPVLTARIRFFAGFAKLERLAVRPQYRKHGYGHNLLTFMLEFCRQKGFRKAYLHAQARLQPFYEEYGFKKIGHDFSFSEYSYVEMVAYLEPKASAARIGMDPMILNRPEANMNEPGPIETALFAAERARLLALDEQRRAQQKIEEFDLEFEAAT